MSILITSFKLKEFIQVWHPRLSKLAGFFLGQGSVQALNILTGFLLLRWLSVEQYAIYALVSSFQATVGILVEMGLAGSLTGLLAGRIDKATVGGYIESVKHYRNLLFFFSLPFIAAFFGVFYIRQGWSWNIGIILFFAVLIDAFFLSWTKYYSLPFLIRHNMAGVYRLQTLFAALRLLGCWILQFSGFIGAALVVSVSALATATMGWAYRFQASPYIEEPKSTDPTKNHEVLHFIRPLVPATLFFAFQGQIGVFLISWFGKVDSIAEVGALGRISQIFVMLGAFNAVLVAPYIAKTPRKILLKRYLCVSFAALGFSALGTFVGFVAPQYLIWILGKNYGDLSPQLGWLILSSSIAYLTNVLFSMHSSRKWIFNWGSWAYIFSVLFTQIFMICTMDLSTTHAVILFGVFSATASFLVQVGWGIYGFSMNQSILRRAT